MSITRTKLAMTLLLAAGGAALAAGPASAQSPSGGRLLEDFTISFMGGIGGSVDEDDPGYDNTALQLGGSFSTDKNTVVGLRLGRIEFGNDERLGNLFDAQVTYLTLAGEYRFSESYYESGLFFGLGFYDIEGTRPLLGEQSETRIGMTGGATGDFDVTERIAIVAELVGHVVPGAEAEFFATGLVGGALRFR